jgi:predicted aspartyl protease
MGRTYQTATIENFNDMAKVVEGTLTSDKVRSLTVNFLVDTGAAMLCLPKTMVQQLGLFRLRTIPIHTANGMMNADVYSHVRLKVFDREASMEVLETLDETPPLMGYLPLEMLVLVVSPTEQKLVGDPFHGGKYMIDMF